MSVPFQINRISSACDDIRRALTEKGISVPSGAKIDDLADLIRQIGVALIQPISTVDGYYLITAEGHRVAARQEV